MLGAPLGELPPWRLVYLHSEQMWQGRQVQQCHLVNVQKLLNQSGHLCLQVVHALLLFSLVSEKATWALYEVTRITICWLTSRVILFSLSWSLYMHSCPRRWQYEQTGRSPGHRDFFRLRRDISINNEPCPRCCPDVVRTGKGHRLDEPA